MGRTTARVADSIFTATAWADAALGCWRAKLLLAANAEAGWQAGTLPLPPPTAAAASHCTQQGDQSRPVHCAQATVGLPVCPRRSAQSKTSVQSFSNVLGRRSRMLEMLDRRLDAGMMEPAVKAEPLSPGCGARLGANALPWKCLESNAE